MKKYLLASVLSALAFPAYADVESFVTAAQKNDLAGVQALIAQGESVNAQNSLGNTALHFAVNNGNMDMIKLLLENGADSSITNEKGWSPASIAEKKQLSEVINIFQATQNNKDLTDLVQKVSTEANQTKQAVANAKQTAAEQAAEKIDKASELVNNKVEKAVAPLNSLANNVAEDEEVVVVDGKLVESPAPVPAPAEENVAAPAPAPAPAEENVAAPAPAPAPAKENVAEQKVENTQATKPALKPIVKPVTAKPRPKLIPSSLHKGLYSGDEEIVYCLYYLGLRTEQHNLTVASEYFAGTTTITKSRYDVIAELAHKFYDTASENEQKNMAEKCSKIITPQNSEKQNQIIRSMNKAVGY